MPSHNPFDISFVSLTVRPRDEQAAVVPTWQERAWGNHTLTYAFYSKFKHIEKL